MNALVIETAYPGDAILSIALADELKRLEPHSRVSYLVRPEVGELLRCAPAIDSVITYDKRGSESGTSGIEKKAQELNALGFDTLFVLHHSTRTSRLVQLLRIPAKIGFVGAPKSFQLNHRVEKSGNSRSADCISLLKACHRDASLNTLPTLSISKSYKLQITFGKGLICIAPGSVWETKCWPPEHFKVLVSMLLDEGYSVAIIGGKDDRARGVEIAGDFPTDRVANLAGKTTFVEAASVLKQSTILVANDSAPIHLATAVRARSVAIFGPTISAFGFAPPIELGVIAEQKGLWCRPCTQHGSRTCPIYSHECMVGLSPVDVLAAMHRGLELSKQ